MTITLEPNAGVGTLSYLVGPKTSSGAARLSPPETLNGSVERTKAVAEASGLAHPLLEFRRGWVEPDLPKAAHVETADEFMFYLTAGGLVRLQSVLIAHGRDDHLEVCKSELDGGREAPLYCGTRQDKRLFRLIQRITNLERGWGDPDDWWRQQHGSVVGKKLPGPIRGVYFRLQTDVVKAIRAGVIRNRKQLIEFLKLCGTPVVAQGKWSLTVLVEGRKLTYVRGIWEEPNSESRYQSIRTAYRQRSERDPGAVAAELAAKRAELSELFSYRREYFTRHLRLGQPGRSITDRLTVAYGAEPPGRGADIPVAATEPAAGSGPSLDKPPLAAATPQLAGALPPPNRDSGPDPDFSAGAPSPVDAPRAVGRDDPIHEGAHVAPPGHGSEHLGHGPSNLAGGSTVGETRPAAEPDQPTGKTAAGQEQPALPVHPARDPGGPARQAIPNEPRRLGPSTRADAGPLGPVLSYGPPPPVSPPARTDDDSKKKPNFAEEIFRPILSKINDLYEYLTRKALEQLRNEPSFENSLSEVRTLFAAQLSTSTKLAEDYSSSLITFTNRLVTLERECREAKAKAENAELECAEVKAKAVKSERDCTELATKLKETNRELAGAKSRIAEAEAVLNAWRQAQAPIQEILERLRDKF